MDRNDDVDCEPIVMPSVPVQHVSKKTPCRSLIMLAIGDPWKGARMQNKFYIAITEHAPPENDQIHGSSCQRLVMLVTPFHACTMQSPRPHATGCGSPHK